MKTTIELYIFRSLSRFFLQVKNIFSYNCLRKPNLLQTNIIDCMELRSAEIRSHIVRRRTSRVYSLCIFRLLQHRHPGRDRMISTSASPSSFTVAPHAPNQSSSSSHVVFESSSHVILESIINHIHKKSVMMGNRHNIIPPISAASPRPECQIQQSSPARTFEE